jgi:DNA invertase Pin-like site-specific DNA recombinase
MNFEQEQKVAATHLNRNAYLYIRQSTLRQVVEHAESTQRQYALRQRAVVLGWPMEKIIVIDSDLGQSGASAVDREGFQKLVTEVSMERAGIVLGLEVSRLARNSSDWHRLLEICALTDTLILDEDGIYDPGHFNDRLLLGLKGTMSEAELHVMRARLRGGLLSKAHRGELRVRLPIGLTYDEQDKVVLDPDQQVQQTIRLFFETFRRTGAASAVVGAFQRDRILFPRHSNDPTLVEGKPFWGVLGLRQALHMLRNPRYAGAFSYGRTRSRRGVEGRPRQQRLPREQWDTLILGSHPGYISWEEYERNQRTILENGRVFGADRRGVPREGPALLQGLAICAICGYRMTVHYHRYGGRLNPEYVCQKRNAVDGSGRLCRTIWGSELDRAIGEVLVGTVTPLTLEVALAVQDELEKRAEEADRLRRAQYERARYQAELARRRYMRVDPDNRLVADSLEAEWNDKLRLQAEAQQEYERQCQADKVLTEQQRAQIIALATDFPRLWRDPKTPQRERKRMARLLIEDVTLEKTDKLTARIRFKGGAMKVLSLPLPINQLELCRTSPEVIKQIDDLLDHYNYRRIAAILNERGLLSGVRKRFDSNSVSRVRLTYGLKDRYNRLRERGLLTLSEIAALLGIHKETVRIWHRRGLLRGHAWTDANQCLYERPGPNLPPKNRGHTIADRRRLQTVADARAQEVQYET